MRYLNIFFYSLILFTLATCTKDEFEDIDVSPPSDLTVRVEVSNDDSGEVTIYPAAISAAYFEIFYGDTADETPDEVQPGEGGTHVYAEGTYSVRVIAYNIKGETIETTQDINVQFNPPANLVVDVEVDPVETNIITVTPTADFAMVFDIYFGDVADEEPTTITAGASAMHTYAESGQYTLRVVARSASSTTVEYTEVLDIVKPAAQLSFPIDFENPDVNYAFTEFGGAELSVVANPDQGGENTSDMAGRLFKTAGSEVWAGGFLTMPQPIDFTNTDQFRMKVWSPKQGAIVKLKVENLTNGDIGYEIDATTTISNGWETLEYDFSGIDKSMEYSKVVVFMDFGNNGDDSEYFFDDIRLYSAGGGLGFPLDFENQGLTYEFTGFGSVTASALANPDPSGINTSDNVAQLIKPAGAETWGGAFITLDGPIDFETTDQMKIKVWSPKNGIIVKAKVENSADQNIAFEVDATTTTTGEWEELSYDFSGIDKDQAYDQFVIFFDFDNPGDDSEYYFDDVVLTDGSGSGGGDELALPIDFESSEISYAFTDFGNVGAAVIDNPDASGENTSAKVGELVKTAGAETWGGSFLQLPEPIDFSGSTTMSMKVWSPKADITVMLKVENATDNGIFVEVPVQTTTTNAWETLTFDMSTVDQGQTYSKVVVFFDFGEQGDDTTYYFDDIRLD